MTLSQNSAIRNRLRAMGSAALLLALSLGTAAAQAPNPFWDEYGELPVQIEQVTGGRSQMLTFVDYRDGMLVAELDGGAAEVSLPVSESMAETLRFDLSILEEARKQIDVENYAGALELMRPKVYPLVKFHEVPEAFVPLHTLLRTMLDTMINAGRLAEAESLFAKIDLSKVSVAYNKLATSLLQALVNAKDYEGAARLSGRLPVEGDYSGNIKPLIDTADALRGAEKFNAVIPLYRKILPLVEDEEQENIKMWLAYSLILDGQLDEGSRLFSQIQAPDPGKRLFSLYKLLEGSREYRTGNYPLALDILTRGFVRAQTSYVWVPEMLYLIGDCYARADDPTAARNVWTEIATLYPDSQWAERAQRSLDQIPSN